MLCNNHSCIPPPDAHPRWLQIRRLARALRVRTRWDIIEFIGRGEKSTTEIFDCLRQRGKQLTVQGLYYHLAELKKAGIIEVAGYLEEGGGAPQKRWRLKSTTLTLDLLGKP